MTVWVSQVAPDQFPGPMPCSVYDRYLLSLAARLRVAGSSSFPPISQMFQVAKYSQRIHPTSNHVSTFPAISFHLFFGFPNMYLQQLASLPIVAQRPQSIRIRYLWVACMDRVR